MVPRTFPSTYETANGETRMVVFFLSSVSGLTKWVDYISVRFTALETQVNNSYNNNGVILVDPISSTTNRQAWVDYVPVFVDENDTAAWRVDANGFIPVGFAVKPTLNLDFAGTKTLDPRITFTRASSATYFDANGVLQTAASGVARFDHNPLTGESLGLLVEESRTNLLVRSEEFDNASWSKTAATITANTIVAPDGTLTADKLVEDATNASHGAHADVSGIVLNSPMAFSVFVKAAERTSGALIVTALTSPFPALSLSFNLANGTISTSGSTVSASSITNIGNGWYRVAISGFTGIAGSHRFSIRINTVAPYTGDGYSGIYIWGAQLEAGAFPTSYIPTVAATVTRNADAASMTGTNFSSWYNATEGTLYGDALFGDLTAGRLIAGISGATAADRITIGLGTNYDVAVVANNVVQANFALGTKVPNSKIVFAYKTDDFAGSANGSAVGTDTSGILPIVDRLFIGTRVGLPAASTINGTIKKLAFYPVRLSNAQLQALTR